MERPLLLASTDRVLVFAPHPDDETLAAGELIQMARACGACVRVVFATDGEDNPWPQRWLEKRWRIGAAGRARWAARRRGEATSALALLGLDGARDARFLGWPDQGLTDVLMCNGEGVGLLAAEIRAFMPTHVVMPALGDRHPDHSALHVMLRLALLDAGIDCMRLDFSVHGGRGGADVVEVRHEPARKQRKLAALAAHASQVALSRRRFVKLALRAERFEAYAGAASVPASPAVASGIRIRLRARWPARGRGELLLVRRESHETRRYRAALPRRPARAMTLVDAQEHRLQAKWQDGALLLESPWPSAALVSFAKINRSGPRLLVHDRELWLDLNGRAAETAGHRLPPAVSCGI